MPGNLNNKAPAAKLGKCIHFKSKQKATARRSQIRRKTDLLARARLKTADQAPATRTAARRLHVHKNSWQHVAANSDKRIQTNNRNLHTHAVLWELRECCLVL
jgi:hypothetical protein